MLIDRETWLIIDKHPSYEVSNLGNVRRGLYLKKQVTDKKGYLSVTLWLNQKPTKCTVARLVANAFLGQRIPGHVVRHINGKNQDNRAANLSYGTAKENEFDKKLHGTNLSCESHPQAKLTAIQVEEIRSRYIRYSKNQNANVLAKEFNVSSVQIIKIVKRKAWK